MKKRTFYVVALLALFVGMSANAQHRIGIIGGLNIAGFDVESPGTDTDISSKTVFGLGGVVDLRLSENFSLYLQPNPSGMNSPGAEQNPQFLLNILHWLSGLL